MKTLMYYGHFCNLQLYVEIGIEIGFSCLKKVVTNKKLLTYFFLFSLHEYRVKWLYERTTVSQAQKFRLRILIRFQSCIICYTEYVF